MVRCEIEIVNNHMNKCYEFCLTRYKLLILISYIIIIII